MTKAELITAVATTGLTKKDAKTAIDTVFATMSDSLAKGDTVSVLGFGTFSVKERAEREGCNPATGEKITIKASKRVAFKAGKALKEKL